MGLFSFLKNAGAKLFGKKESSVEEMMNALRKAVEDLKIPIENMDLELDDDKVIVYGQCESQADKEKIVLALGNVEGIATVDDRISVVNPEPEAKFYEVKKGDSLSKIAKEYYGDPMKYPVIFEANKPMLKDPNLIYPGQVLRIPPVD
jgi:hypothetical protein